MRVFIQQLLTIAPFKALDEPVTDLQASQLVCEKPVWNRLRSITIRSATRPGQLSSSVFEMHENKQLHSIQNVIPDKFHIWFDCI